MYYLRTIIAFALTFVSLQYVEAQNKKLEYQNLQFLKEKDIISTREFQLESSNWDWLDEIEPKVDFPFDFGNYSFKYRDTFQFQSLSKEVIYDRIMEFISINGGRLENVIRYANVERGVVVAKGNIPIVYSQDYRIFLIKTEDIRSSYISSTIIFRMKDGEMEVRLIPETFIDLYYGAIESSTYTYEAEVTAYYPLTNVKPGIELDRKRNRKNAYLLINAMHHRILDYMTSIKLFISAASSEFNDYR